MNRYKPITALIIISLVLVLSLCIPLSGQGWAETLLGKESSPPALPSLYVGTSVPSLEVNENFDSPLNPAAYIISGDALQDTFNGDFVVTPALEYQAGSIFLSQQVTQLTHFVASFDFQIGGGDGADGMTFAIIPGPDLLGRDGGYLGYDGLGGYAIEFDTFKNSSESSENHIAVIRDDVFNHLYSTDNIPELEDNGWFHCDITFSGGSIKVFLENESIAYPPTEIIDFDIPSYIPFNAYLGFTAGTGGDGNNHIVDNLKISAYSANYSALTHIGLRSPASESVATGVPIFIWSSNGGSNDVFAVDLSLDYSFAGYWSTYNNMGQLIRENSWTPPSALWDIVPSGSYVFWRVRGADLGHTPLSIITSSDINWLYKP
jgi:hypothetical protein